ncbi:MAG: LysR family transcriptional regulator [Stappia sp.]|uniref:LysR family transcriptional regulator n=1 Tax=Stappia sp. TaxID=1870903 RepID=UPI000C60F89D|nr:LysR substrate-binding domain-containing protein [Stappia sp.]MAA97595.1 LysR family transcriptional regulator [Stappia sp.]MBM22585.1 LysR family transcriptional regulator [Stappia sp.]|tara:strand:- start:3121 stop:4023 length:903 start_codon:yes stop_codon:yes gene_type:complete
MDLVPGKGTPLIETDLYRTFLVIAETASFSKAAEVIGRTPSAVSMQIKKLEGLLGVAVFAREGRSVRMTPEGEALVGYARRILMLNEEAVALFRSPAIEGEVRFGAPSDFGTRFLPNILTRFARSHPGVNVDVHLDGSPQLLKKLKERQLDLVLYTARPDSDVALGGEIVYTEPLAWAGLENGVAYSRDPLPLALSVSGCPWRKAARIALDKAEHPYRIAYQSFHSAGQEAALLADLAVAPFPASVIAAPLQRLDERHGLPEIGNYHLILKEAGKAGKASDAFASHVVACFDELKVQAIN